MHSAIVPLRSVTTNPGEWNTYPQVTIRVLPHLTLRTYSCSLTSPLSLSLPTSELISQSSLHLIFSPEGKEDIVSHNFAISIPWLRKLSKHHWRDLEGPVSCSRALKSIKEEKEGNIERDSDLSKDTQLVDSNSGSQIPKRKAEPLTLKTT